MRTTFYIATAMTGDDYTRPGLNCAALLSAGEPWAPDAPQVLATHPTHALATSPHLTRDPTLPLRLFEIEGAWDPGTGAVATLRVRQELPSWPLFGPEGTEVLDLLYQVQRLGFRGRRRLVWAARWSDAHLVWAARERAETTATEAGMRTGGVVDAAIAASRKVGAWPVSVAVSNAAVASMVRDQISLHDYQLLVAPVHRCLPTTLFDENEENLYPTWRTRESNFIARKSPGRQG